MNRTDQKILDYLKKFEGSWTPGYGSFTKVVAAKKLKTGAEIGVAFGGHAENILKNSKVEHLYGIDPFVHIEGYDDPMNLPPKEFDALHKFTVKRLSRFGKRYSHIRKFSDEAAADVPELLDFVYIDADHSYGGVKSDLQIWYPKIREGGIIAGHDYGHVNFPGVKQAIDEFFSPFGNKINEEGEGVWWIVKKSPGVSFIMPAYNAEKTIKASVESILNGNFCPSDEIIIVDDCSSDKTGAVLQALKRQHPKIKVITHAINKGGGAARNTAVENARNDLIFCLDSDNLLMPGSVPKLRDFLLTNNYDVATFGALKYFKTSPQKPTHQWDYKDSDSTLAGALSSYKFPGSSGNYLYTKDSWLKAERYPEFAGALDTWGFGVRQLATGSKMKNLEGTYYYHRYGHQSYWMRESRQGSHSLKALQILIPYLDMLNDADVSYMVSPGSRLKWFESLETHPIKLKKGLEKPTLRSRIKRRLIK